jgi:hypothetical protein
MNGKCPICTLDCQLDIKGQDADVTCSRCGKFIAGAGLDLRTRSFTSVPKFLVDKGADPRDTTKVGELLAPYLSIYIREQTATGFRPVEIDIGSARKLEEQAETYAYTPIGAKPGKLLRLLEKRSLPGQQICLDLELDYPAAHALNAAEARFYLQALQKDELIEYQNTPEAGQTKLTTFVTITLAGWLKLGATGSASRTAFVAMHFDANLDSAFSEGIEPAIREAGYEPRRVDMIAHNEKICDRIVVEIRRSRFLVADVTDQRQGVYFEAGFAIALGLPVIWSCREDDLKNVHFDTRQYNHIVWKEPADLRRQLHDRIMATIGPIR